MGKDADVCEGTRGEGYGGEERDEEKGNWGEGINIDFTFP